MKKELTTLIEQTLEKLKQSEQLPADAPSNFKVEQTKDPSHGDLATNVAMTLAKAAKKPPRALAEMIVDQFVDSPLVEKIDIAGPGFINFFLTQDSQNAIIKTIHEQQSAFGDSDVGAGQKIHMEYVSANPTGPLHVGHGRGAAYGATLSNLLKATGHQVHREYYVNDAGRQMHILATSVWLRYLELNKETFTFPSNGYKGDYIKSIAAQIQSEFSDTFVHPASAVFASVRPDADENGDGDKEAHIDDLIANAKKLLGNDQYRRIFEQALNGMVSDIREDLAEFGVNYDRWFSEQSLNDDGLIDTAIERLKKKGYMFEENGALWFRSTDFGDDKDRVVVRENGEKTYFASDIAYHMEKLDRGHNRVIDVLGADHHGYIARVKAAMAALGADPDQLSTPLIQFVSLFRGQEKVAMSTRSGSFVTLKELREEIGNDAARFFYVMRKADQAMDFDLELAKSQKNENPLFYIQYAHARICSAQRKLPEKSFALDIDNGLEQLGLLESEKAAELMKALVKFPEVVKHAAINLEPHLVVNYLRELARHFHSYYDTEKCIVDEKPLRDARFALITAVQIVLAKGLQLIGVSAPESM